MIAIVVIFEDGVLKSLSLCGSFTSAAAADVTAVLPIRLRLVLVLPLIVVAAGCSDDDAE